MLRPLNWLLPLAALLVPTLAGAQSLPSKPVRILVPFPAGMHPEPASAAHLQCFVTENTRRWGEMNTAAQIVAE